MKIIKCYKFKSNKYGIIDLNCILAFVCMKIRHLKYLIILQMFYLHSFAQDSTDNISYQYWLDYNISYPLNPAYDLYGDVGARSVAPDNIWWTIYARPTLRKYLNETVELHGGLGFYYTINRNNSSNITEIRPYQGIKINWPDLKRLPLQHYVRLEERIQMISQDWSFKLRLRYMISTKLRWRRDLLEKYFFVPAQAEIFGNLNGQADQFNDFLRLTSGLGYAMTSDWTLEFNFIFQRSEDTIGKDRDTSDIIFRLRIRHTITPKGSIFEDLLESK